MENIPKSKLLSPSQLPVSSKPHADIREYRGIPTLFVNNNPEALWAVTYREKPWSIPSLQGTGERFAFAFTNMIDVDQETESSIKQVESRIADMLSHSGAPFAGLVLSIQPSVRWATTNPDQMTKFDRPVDWTKTPMREASWASADWRRDSVRFLTSLVTQLDEVFDGRVLFYQIGAGHCGENGPAIDPYETGSWYCGDLSQPMLEGFRAYLRERYVTTDRLREAWSDPKASIDSAMPPSRVERLSTEWFSLRSPLRSQTADYYRFLSSCVESCVISWCSAIKCATQRRAVTGSPMGSILDAGLNAFHVHHMAKSSYQRVNAHPDVDFLQSPASYVARDPGRGDTSAMIPLGSIRLAGKMWMRDFDSRTSLALSDEDHPTGSLWRTPRNDQEDRAVLIRDGAYSIIKGGGVWWHEIHDRMFSRPIHQETVKRLHRAAGIVARYASRSAIPGLAVLVDDESIRRFSNSNRLVFSMNYEARQRHWSRTGCAYEVYHVDDVASPNFPLHPVIMVTNGYCLSDRQVEAIRTRVKQNNATLIWIGAPGVQADKQFDLARAEKITGFRIKAVDAEAIPRLNITRPDHPWVAGVNAFGGGPHDYDDSGSRAIGPQFYVDPRPEDVVLGISDALALPSLVVSTVEGVPSLYCAAPYLPYKLLRNVLESAGAHVFAPAGDVVHAAGQLLLIHTYVGGKRMIRPVCKAETAVDLIEGLILEWNRLEIAIDLQKIDTRFLYFGDSVTATQIVRELE